MPPSPPWTGLFLELLCKLYQWLEGDCGDLSSDPSAAIATVDDKYQQSGPPQFATPAERDQFIALLDSIKAALAMPENTLDPSDTKRMSDLIKQILGDIET